ncbi:MAG: hypothetical protein QW128_00655 [Thermoprotei archaeon]
MKTMNQDTDESKELLVYKIVALLSGIVMAFSFGYGIYEMFLEYITTGSFVIGAAMVSIEFPYKYFAKPVTYFAISLVVFWYSVMHVIHKKIISLDKEIKALLSIIALGAAYASGYELLYNFMVWNAIVVTQIFKGNLNIDQAIIGYPDPHLPWNLVFATKLFSALFVIALYTFYYLSKNTKTE